MSYVINLFGAPGTGKSTLAAGLVHSLKMDGHEAILIPELFKSLALKSQMPTYRDEIILLGKQIEMESAYYGAAKYIVTECPLELHAFYADYGSVLNRPIDFSRFEASVTKTVQRLREATPTVKTINYLLTPGSFAYSPEGRYQTEGESRAIADNLCEYLSRSNLPFVFSYADVCTVKYRIYAHDET